MEDYSRKHVGCRQLLDLIPRNGDLVVKQEEESVTEEERLELCLGPPGAAAETRNRDKTRQISSGCCFPSKKASFLLHLQIQEPSSAETEKRAASSSAKPPLHNGSSSNKRAATGQVVGWPPVRSFRKHASNGSCSKFPSDASPSPASDTSSKTLFVKINMDGLPIGRKIDLKAYENYEKLTSAVHNLFTGLLPVGHESPSEEYTLVYEDNECDRMLVGDVPWDMFISNVKRLRLLKTSDLPLTSSDGGKRILK